MDPQTEEL